MLAYLQEISSSNSAKWYVRGLILSQVESEHDLNFAYLLQKNIFKKLEIPIVPLFETSQSLLNSCVILEKFFKTNPEILIEHQNRWSSRFEVMVGYSDSGKESGILKGRFLIQKSLMMLEKYLSKKKLVPIYFHGSGGSIERGGGTIQEQTSWWPTSSLNNYKCTIQGEMIARSFMSSPIFLSQINQINKSFLISQNNKKDKDNISEDKNFENFCMEVGKNYETLIHDPNFVKNIVDATPYNFLDILKIGSRPTKRQTEGFKLRAIPWILCWTQTRLLLPTWIGVGPAFKSLSHQNKLKLRKTYQTNFMFRSYIHQLGFTLKKVELSIWYHYLLNKTQNKAQAEILFKPFEIEFNETIKFFKFITQEKNLTFYRPWLGESIYFRSSMIHPLNLIQMEAVNRKDELLLRETVTGISCGMMTTG